MPLGVPATPTQQSISTWSPPHPTPPPPCSASVAQVRKHTTWQKTKSTRMKERMSDPWRPCNVALKSFISLVAAVRCFYLFFYSWATTNLRIHPKMTTYLSGLLSPGLCRPTGTTVALSGLRVLALCPCLAAPPPPPPALLPSS